MHKTVDADARRRRAMGHAFARAGDDPKLSAFGPIIVALTADDAELAETSDDEG
jgi:hypothetical protein